jgi:hypothetical protein
MATYIERCSADIADWAARPDSRDEAIESLRVELVALADEVFTWRSGDYVRRLALATGRATAVAATDEEFPWDVDHTPIARTDDLVADGLDDDDFCMQVECADDEGRSGLRPAILYKLLHATQMLDEGHVTELLAWAVKAAFALWTADLDDGEFVLSTDE